MSHLSSALYLIAMLLAAGMPSPLHGQSADWKFQTAAGATALTNDDYVAAISAYRAALDLSQQFRPEDRRRPTSIRNLANVFTVMGAYDTADSLYLAAITVGLSMFTDDHNYMVNLYSEHARLRDAMRRSAELDAPIETTGSLYERLAKLLNDTRNITTIQSGMALPVTDPLSTTHSASLLHVGMIRVPITRSLTFNLSRVAGKFHAKKPLFSSHLSFRGIGFGVGLRVGKWILDGGGGPFSIRTNNGKETKIAITTGISRTLWDGSDRRTKPGYYLDLSTNLVKLPVAPGSDSGGILVGIGLTVGYYD